MIEEITIYTVLSVVKGIVNSMSGDSRIKTEVMRDTDASFWVILELSNYMGEIVVSENDFAPYRYVSFNLMDCRQANGKAIYTWYDKDTDTLEEIVSKIKEGLEIALSLIEPNSI